MTSMKTYRGGSGWSGSTWPGSPGTADETTWSYYAATGLLSAKTDAASKSVGYTYTVAGQIARRTWARGVTTDYAYDSGTGELLSVDYSDGTTDLGYTYNRFGQLATVTDYTGTRTLDHCLCGKLVEETLSSFYGWKLTYDLATTGFKGRTLGYTLSELYGPTTFTVDYAYRSDGRLDTISSGGRTFTYGYESNSHLVSTVSTGTYTDTRTYDPYHDWVDSRTTTISSVTKAAFAYTQNSLGMVTEVTRTGEMFNRYGNGTQGLKTTYGYNDRLELTSEITYLGGTSTVLTGRDDSYAYDNMGNRTSTTHNGDTATYTPDALNRYTQRTVPGVFDVSGATSSTSLTIGGSSGGIARHGDYFFKGHPMNNSSSGAYDPSLEIDDGIASPVPTIAAFVQQTPATFVYDDDGNLKEDGRHEYDYDAENRLVWVQNYREALSGAPFKALHILYDYLGRRALVHHYEWVGGGWSTVKQERFMYEGWNLIAKLTDMALTQTYVWGKDLSGTIQGAGGVGGLLLANDGGESYLPAYDAMGNVHAMIKASDGSIAAAYEYDAFGRTIRESGPYAAQNPFRYSTKYTDENGLVYYGLRYYSPSLGRFINRDPIGERGGRNLYAFARNNGVNSWDYLGLENELPPVVTGSGECRESTPYEVEEGGEIVLKVDYYCHGAFVDSYTVGSVKPDGTVAGNTGSTRGGDVTTPDGTGEKTGDGNTGDDQVAPNSGGIPDAVKDIVDKNGVIKGTVSGGMIFGGDFSVTIKPRESMTIGISLGAGFGLGASLGVGVEGGQTNPNYPGVIDPGNVSLSVSGGKIFGGELSGSRDIDGYFSGSAIAGFGFGLGASVGLNRSITIDLTGPANPQPIETKPFWGVK